MIHFHLNDGFDPTGLGDVRRRMNDETTRRWTKTALAVKRAIVADDALGIGPKAPRMAMPIEDKAHQFKRWLDERLMSGVVGHDAGWIRPHVDAASTRAFRRSVADQVNLGFLLPGAAPSAEVCHAASVSALAGICDHVSQRAHASVAAGLLAQARPAQIARLLDKAFGEGLRRSRMLGEHAVTQAYSQAALDAMEARGVTHVGTVSERAARSKTWDSIATPLSRAAGVMFIDPAGNALFLHRTDGEGWAWPGGGVEEPESLENGAHREAQEECGGAPLGPLTKVWRSNGHGVDFTTFRQDVDSQFTPTLNHEHDAFSWASLDDPPSPLHPGVAEMLRGLMRTDALADAARKTPQVQHPATGKFVTQTVGAREHRRSKRTGQFRRQGLSFQAQRKEELAEARFSRIEGGLDVLTAGDDRVCDICDDISVNGPYTINQARSLIPAHPACRCLFTAAKSMALDAPSGWSWYADFDPGEPRDDHGKWVRALSEESYEQHLGSPGRTSREVNQMIEERHEQPPPDWSKGVVLYHGTSEKAYADIKKHGLIPHKSAGGDEWAKQRGMGVAKYMMEGGRATSVYMSDDADLAKSFAEIGSRMTGSTPVLLEIDVPADKVSGLKQDEHFRAEPSHAYRYEGTIPPAWIHKAPLFTHGMGGHVQVDAASPTKLYAVIFVDGHEDV